MEIHKGPSGTPTYTFAVIGEEDWGDEPANPDNLPTPDWRPIRYPGTGKIVAARLRLHQTVLRKTPAMRHGIAAARRPTDGQNTVPNLLRLLYRPWLYAGTKVGAKLD